jgi:hypothetical protein
VSERVKTWRCQRVTAGVRCGTDNPTRLRKCSVCSKPRPKRKRPDHMRALDLPYAAYVALNGGIERCGICGVEPGDGARRLHRDHNHRTGRPRALLCFRCNSALRPYMTREWLLDAAEYLERTEGRS